MFFFLNMAHVQKVCPSSSEGLNSNRQTNFGTTIGTACEWTHHLICEQSNYITSSATLLTG